MEATKTTDHEADVIDPSVAEAGPSAEPLSGTSSEKYVAKDQVKPSITSDLKEKRTATSSYKTDDRKQRPEKLDIAAAKDKSRIVGREAATMEATRITRKGDDLSGLDLSQPPTPGTSASQSSVTSTVRQHQSRATRIPPVPKAEASPPGFTPSNKQTSRRPSLASINRPGTPTSERISDNASFTSATVSRASSPPPSKVGSAPVRQVTKNQQKKERQARAKQAEGTVKADEPAAKVEEVQAPIIGRKKKTKKEKPQGTADSTPTATRPVSPVSKEDMLEGLAAPAPAPAPATPPKETKNGLSKVAADVKESETPSSPATPATSEQQRASLTAASIFAGLLKAGEVNATAADLFKTVPGLNHRFDSIELESVGVEDPSEDQLRLLDQGEAVHIEKSPNNHVIMLPGRRPLRGLSAEQASRYLELRKQALFNGDVPSHQALDGLIPAPPPVSVAAMSSMSQRASKQKKLVNRFSTPIAETEPSSVQKRRNASAGTFDENMLNRKPTLTVAEAEQQLSAYRKETEVLEKKMSALLKKNKRLLFGNAH